MSDWWGTKEVPGLGPLSWTLAGWGGGHSRQRTTLTSGDLSGSRWLDIRIRGETSPGCEEPGLL